MSSQIYSYNYKNNNLMQNQYYNYNFNNTYNNFYQNNFIPRRTYESSNNYLKMNNIILNQTNPNVENRYLFKKNIGKNNNQIKIIKNNYSPNICTCHSKPINNFYIPRKNYYYNNNKYNNNSFHVIKQNRRNNSYKEKINVNNMNYLNNINPINKINIRNKTPPNFYSNNSTIFISHLSNPQYKNINYSSNQPKIKINIIKAVPKLNVNKINSNTNLEEKSHTERECLNCLNNNKYNYLNNDDNNRLLNNYEDTKKKYNRRLEITEITKVILPNQIFKPKEIYEKKEGPIVELKKNRDGSVTKIIKENLEKTIIENSIIGHPKVDLEMGFGKNVQNLALIKQKITKENISTVKSNIFNNENKNVSQINKCTYPKEKNEIKQKIFLEKIIKINEEKK